MTLVSGARTLPRKRRHTADGGINTFYGVQLAMIMKSPWPNPARHDGVGWPPARSPSG